jgi:hypothetical protein
MSETKQRLIGGRGVEFQHFANRVITGMLVGAPTTASEQATGATGNLTVSVNIAAGLLSVGSIVKEYAAAADYTIFATAASPIPNLSEVYFDIIAYKSVGNNTIYLKVVQGIVAVTTVGAVVPTDAVIEAYFETGTPWMKVGRTLVKRTGDTTLVQSYDNTVRNTLVPGTVHYGTNPLA